MLKLELHAHTDEDPQDLIPHTAQALIDRAADLGYHALAITLHDRQLPLAGLAGYARDRGLTLLPGIERTIQGKHVLLLNFSEASEGVRSFDDLARLKAREPGLVVAPHPFFPLGSCLGGWMSVYPDLFDAVEYNGMFTRAVNFNTAAERWARAHGKPIVGNGDVHQLAQLGTTWTWVDADAHPDAICEAIRAGKVRVEAYPHSTATAARIMGHILAGDVRRELRRWFSRRTPEQMVGLR